MEWWNGWWNRRQQQYSFRNDLKNVPLGNGTFSVTITDNERKWNINWAANPNSPQMPILQQAMTIIGVNDAAMSSTIIDSIRDWIDRDDEHNLSGAENDYYMHLNPPYYCKNGWIDDLSELLLIKGIRDNPEIYWGSNSTNHPISAYQTRGDGLRLRGQQPPQYPFGLVDLLRRFQAANSTSTPPPLRRCK